MRNLLQQLKAPAQQTRLTCWLLLRLLALIYLIALLSLAVRVAGPAGPQGILPIDRYMADLTPVLDCSAYWI